VFEKTEEGGEKEERGGGRHAEGEKNENGRKSEWKMDEGGCWAREAGESERSAQEKEVAGTGKRGGQQARRFARGCTFGPTHIRARVEPFIAAFGPVRPAGRVVQILEGVALGGEQSG
jgi:hypothetical protein